MIFTLEVLQADHGDCLLLHYGKKSHPKVIVIDGGPSGIYKDVLKPRLLEIKQSLAADKPLDLSMVMVSHMDDDHVNGILALTDDAIAANEINSKEFEMSNFRFNAFDDIIGNKEVPGIASIASSASAASLNDLPMFSELDQEVSAVIASTGQGRRLRENVKTLTAVVNNPFTPLRGKANLVRSDGNNSLVEWDDNLIITVLHPNAQRLDELQKKWDEDIANLSPEELKNSVVADLGNKDKSPFNLSSIVCLVEFSGKKILLTGDARSDDIAEGLESNGLLTNGKIHVDILKMPHHGSERDLSKEFFDVVSADNYVISANGKFNNPDAATLEFLGEINEQGDGSTLYLTNHEGALELRKKIDGAIKKYALEGSKLVVKFRDPDSLSVKVDLLDPVDY